MSPRPKRETDRAPGEAREAGGGERRRRRSSKIAERQAQDIVGRGAQGREGDQARDGELERLDLSRSQGQPEKFLSAVKADANSAARKFAGKRRRRCRGRQRRRLSE